MILNYRAFAYVVFGVFLATLVNCGGGDYEIANPVSLQANQSDLTMVQGESVILLIDAAFLNEETKKNVNHLMKWAEQDNVDITVTDAGIKLTAVKPGKVELIGSYAGLSIGIKVNVLENNVTALRFGITNLALAINESQKVSVLAIYRNGGEKDVTAQVEFTSMDPSVASVSNRDGDKGRISGLMPGTAVIMAKYADQKSELNLIVTGSVLDAISIAPLEGPLEVGKEIELKVMGRFSQGEERDVSQEIQWSSSDEKIASIVEGRLTGVSAGQVTIGAKHPLLDKTVILAVDVVSIPVAIRVIDKIKLMPATLVMKVDETQALQVQIEWSDGAVTTEITEQVSCISADPLVVEVNESCIATAKKAGETQITVTAANDPIIETTSIKVQSSDVVTALRFGQSRLELPAGESQQVAVFATYDNNEEKDVTALAEFSSSNPLVATVSNRDENKGQITAIKKDNIVITAKYADQLSELNVVVTLAVLKSISLTPYEGSLKVNKVVDLTVIGRFGNGEERDVSQEIQWSSSDEKIASIVEGRLTGVSAGQVTIGAKHPLLDKTVTLAVDVVALPLMVKIKLIPANVVMKVGETQALQVQIEWSDGAVTNEITEQVSCISTDSLVVEVNEGCIATAKKAGETQITVTAANDPVIETMSIKVQSSDVVTALRFEQDSLELPAGESQQVNVLATYDNKEEKDVTALAEFSSSNSLVAVVDNSGENKGRITAIALTQDSVVITAKYADQLSELNVVITQALLKSISMTPYEGPLEVGSVVDLTVMGRFGNDDELDVSQDIRWSSSDEKVATVEQGQLTGISAGSVTIFVKHPVLDEREQLTIEVILVPTAIQFKNPITELAKGQIVALTVEGQFPGIADWSEISSDLKWQIDDPMVVALADSTGRIEALAEGSTSISVSYLGVDVDNPLSLTVTASGVVKIKLLPSNVAMSIGERQTFQAQAILSDGSVIEDVTDQVTCISQDSFILEMAAGCIGTAKAVGATKVVATAANDPEIEASQVLVSEALVLGTLDDQGVFNAQIPSGSGAPNGIYMIDNAIPGQLYTVFVNGANVPDGVELSVAADDALSQRLCINQKQANQELACSLQTSGSMIFVKLSDDVSNVNAVIAVSPDGYLTSGPFVISTITGEQPYKIRLNDRASNGLYTFKIIDPSGKDSLYLNEFYVKNANDEFCSNQWPKSRTSVACSLSVAGSFFELVPNVFDETGIRDVELHITQHQVMIGQPGEAKLMPAFESEPATATGVPIPLIEAVAYQGQVAADTSRKNFSDYRFVPKLGADPAVNLRVTLSNLSEIVSLDVKRRGNLACVYPTGNIDVEIPAKITCNIPDVTANDVLDIRVKGVNASQDTHPAAAEGGASYHIMVEKL